LQTNKGGNKEMDNKRFIELCKEKVVQYFNEKVDKTVRKQISEDDVFVVWSCKTLQNNKALLSTTVADGMYYELTYNGDKNELYFDAYKKWENVKYEL
jgi:phosphoribosylpyrophosphate synthetase